VDIARSEVVEADLDRLLERRSRKGDVDPDEREALWQESVRRYNARRSEEMRAARIEYHQGQAVRLRAALEALIRQHEAQAARLCELVEN
jgi:CBS-domain-containing membrane protein